MKNLVFIIIAVLVGLSRQSAAAQCTTDAGTISPAMLNECASPPSSFNVFHNDNEVLDANDALKLVLHDGTPTTLGNVLQFYSSQWPAFIVTMPPTAVPGVTYQIAAIAGNPDGNGGIDLTDPCLSISGGVSVTFHLPPVVDLPDGLVLGCNEAQLTVEAEITPPGNYEIVWDTWGTPNGPGVGYSISVSNPGFLTAYVNQPINGCWVESDTIQITAEPGRPTVFIQPQGGGGCGQLNVIANATSGQGPFEFLWSNGATTPSTTLPEGTHCVTITAANGCISSDCIVVPAAGNLTASVNFVQSDNCEQALLQAIATGGSGTLTYQWSSGTSNTNTNNAFDEGENYVTVTDASGCEAIASYFVEDDPFLCGTLQLLLFHDLDANCAFNNFDVRLANFKLRIEDAGGQTVFYGNSSILLNGYSWVGKLNPGTYTVSVELPNALWLNCQDSYSITLGEGTTTLLELPLQAVEPCPNLSTDLSIGELNWCTPHNYASILCSNLGTEAVDGAYVELLLEDHITVNSSNLSFTDLGNHLYRFDLGTMGVGEIRTIHLSLKVDCNATLGATPCLSVTIFPHDPCPSLIDPDWSGASLRVTSECGANEVKFFIENVGTADMSAPLNYVIIEDAVLFQVVPSDPPIEQGGIREITLPANGSTWRIEVEQEQLHPGASMPALALEGCEDFGSQGFVNLFPPDDADDFVDIACMTISGPFDPNDKQGLPLGLGEQHLIRPGTDLEYTIRFQNTGTDTAETVVIRDTLDAWLDPLSIEPGAASHPYRFDFYGEGAQVKFVFEHIMLLDSNLNEPASHGFVKFRIKHRPNIPLNTDIFNRAAIYFDYNPPIITNTTQHRIGEFFIVQSTKAPGFEQLNLTVKPNPVEGQAVISVEGSDGLAPFEAALFDALGRPIAQLAPSKDGFLLDRNGLPSGIYFVQVTQTGAVVATAKVIVQ